jgi:heptaprenylglyceryl phosphate synthase
MELISMARKSWEGYMMRNDSVIVDLFQGQYQSTLVCPECEKVSLLCLLLSDDSEWSTGVHHVRSFHVPHTTSASTEQVEAYRVLYPVGYDAGSCQGPS